MPRQTIKSLQEQLKTCYKLRQDDNTHIQHQEAELKVLREQIEGMRSYHEQLKQEVQWHKRLSQNLSEAICAHMRNR